MTSPKIAIIGAGPAGLTLARTLLVNGINAIVFESDKSSDARSQGGSLDLTEELGQAALRCADLHSEWAQKIARPSGMDFVCVDKHGIKHLDVRDIDFGRPESDRGELRRLLLNSLPADMIRWNSKLRSVEKGTLQFDHGTETGFDLIVGADGAWSKVRPAVHPHVPFYSSVSMCSLWLRDVDNKHPELGQLVGKGSFFALGGDDGKAILCQRQADESVMVYICKQTHESWTRDIDTAKPELARATLLDDFKSSGWSPELLKLIRNCDDDVVMRGIHMLAPGLRWRNVPGFALVGDAAHLMSPFAGEGVNVAMWDSMTLAASIVEHTGDLTAAVTEYEQNMFRQAQDSCLRSWVRLNDRFNCGASEKFASHFKRMLQEAGVAKPQPTA